MKQIGFKGKVKKGLVTVNVSVPLLSFKEDDTFIVYSPARCKWLWRYRRRSQKIV